MDRDEMQAEIDRLSRRLADETARGVERESLIRSLRASHDELQDALAIVCGANHTAARRVVEAHTH